MSQLQVYKASAGSGKTFRLAIEYLKIILSEEWNYKHILAVTFTNKATTEMKHRVIDELYKLAKEEKTAYLEIIATELGLPEIEITSRAKNRLKRLLHDYSRFSVSTIDSFFQRVIKAFNRELGINTAYQVDLEEDLILEEAVDQLLLSLGEDENLLEWLKQFAHDKIMEGEGWNLKRDILALGRQIYNETFKDQNEQLYQKLNDRAFIRKYREQLQQIIFQFENKLKQLGKAGLNLMEENGLSVNDFKYGKSGAANTFNWLCNGELKLGARLQAAIADPENLYKQPDKNNVAPTAMKLHPLLVEAVDFYEKKSYEYNTARLISKQLYTLAILVDLQTTMRKLVREKGVVLISESGNLLKEIISDADTPFVYEKTGVYYNHFMIDEFQDTSGLQWNNFRPLINNSLSEDNISLLVGDVKQAIYRWRNGDWRLLAGKVNDHFPFNGVHEHVLGNNWRSDGNIIRFNNSIFRLVPSVLDEHFLQESNHEFAEDVEMPSLKTIYRDSIQQIGQSKKEEDGYIRMRFLKKEKDEDNEARVLDEMVETIKQLQQQGAAANKIAVLVRKKEQAKTIAERLLIEKALEEPGYNFNILSSESLYVKSSQPVNFLLTLLELITHPDDELFLVTANHLYYNNILPALKKIGKEPSLSASKPSGQLEMDFRSPYQPSIEEQFETVDHPHNILINFLGSSSYQQEISSKNVQEIIFKLCDIFNLFELREEQAYLQAFIDQVGKYMKSYSTGLASFLKWWDVQGQKKTIAVSEDFDAIRIQTIHKAKGLEYKYVLIPFCDWPIGISAQFAPIIWCKPNTGPFNQLELVPVKYENLMAESHFKRQYFEEKISLYIDSLNMLYVAFTRAQSALFTWSEYTEKMITVGDLIRNSLVRKMNVEDSPTNFVLTNYFDEENGKLEIGNLNISTKKQTVDETSISLDEFRFSDFSKLLRLKKQNENLFIGQKEYEIKINKGKIIHEILAQINTTKELAPAINQLILQGKIENQQAADILQELTTMLSDPKIKSWFDGSYRVVNERTILTGKRGLLRPDRIMIGKDQTIVVDYKSGETEQAKYKYQLKNYIRELEACGFTNIQGYIWYTKTNKRVKIEA